MPPWVVAAAVIVVLLVAAALSDVRDRRDGLDPKVRAEQVVGHRRKFRELRAAGSRRRLKQDPADQGRGGSRRQPRRD